MRSFVILCFVALASAQYNYNAGGGGGFASPSNQVSRTSSGGFPSSSGGFPSSSGGFPSSSAGFPSSSNPESASTNESPAFANDGGFEKEFFTYTADDSDFAQPEASEQIANNLKQGLRVVFIKGPENKGLEDAALALAKSASEQKTAIYVLNKQTDIGDLANKLNSISNNNAHKPEVHFVKYRTPEDAENAQSQIQNQYESLGGGPSKSVHGGVAPVIDFSSKAPSAGHGGHGGHGGPHGGHQNSYGQQIAASSHSGYTLPQPTNSYVPPSAASSRQYIPPSNSYIPPSIFRSLRS